MTFHFFFGRFCFLSDACQFLLVFFIFYTSSVITRNWARPKSLEVENNWHKPPVFTRSVAQNVWLLPTPSAINAAQTTVLAQIFDANEAVRGKQLEENPPRVITTQVIGDVSPNQ